MRYHSSSPRTRLFTAAALTGMACVSCPAQQSVEARIARIQSGLLPSVVIKDKPPSTMKPADRMQYYHVPGVSIAFFDHGQVVWARGYGVADSETGRPVTPETLFQAASIGKPIAPLGALRLVDEGELKLDENVNDQLSSWQLPENELTANQKVTLRRILSHSAGLNVHGFGGYEQTRPAALCRTDSQRRKAG